MLALPYEGVIMINLNKVVASLQTEYSRLQKEMERVGKALGALGHANGSRRGKRILSKEARERIAERSEEHTSELQSQFHLVCRLLLEKKKDKKNTNGHSQTPSPTISLQLTRRSRVDRVDLNVWPRRDIHLFTTSINLRTCITCNIR